MTDFIKHIRKIFTAGKYRLTLHAELERDRDGIFMTEIEECFEHGTIQVIEDYPDDQRGHSGLLLGFTAQGVAIHFVCAVHEEMLIFITMYRPSADKWINYRERKP